MSLGEFERAFADLVASPSLCRELRGNADRILQRYELSVRERHRLESIVGQRGMSTSCSLYRSNRVTPIYTLLHFSCLLLGDALESELNIYWSSEEFLDFQFQLEIGRFASFLKRRLAGGMLTDRRLGDVLDFEFISNELQFLPRRRILGSLPRSDLGVQERAGVVRLHPLARVLKTSCDLPKLLEGLASGRSVDSDPVDGEHLYLVSAINEASQLVPLDARFGALLFQLHKEGAFGGTADELEVLIRAGAVV